MDFVSRVGLLCLVLLASVAEVNALTTSFNLSDFTSASQAAVGGLTFNGAATSDGTLNTNANTKAAGNFFFNQQINANSFTSFSAFYLVSYDTSQCEDQFCNDGVALILQTVGLNFYSSSTTWSIPQQTGSFAVGFENSNRYEYEVDDGNATVAGSAYFIYSAGATKNVYTWVDYNHGTLQLDVYFSLNNIKSSAVHAISKSGVDIFGSSDLNLPSFGTYYVGLGASTGMIASSSGEYSGSSNEGHKVISMWFNTCLDCNAPCGAPTGYTVTTCPLPIADLTPIISFSTPFKAGFPAYTLNGNAQLLNNFIRLTDSSSDGETGSTYLTSPVDISKPFSVFYQVKIQCIEGELGTSSCGNGFAFVLQPTSTTLLGGTGNNVAIEGASKPYWAITALTYTTMTLNLATFPFSQSNYNSSTLAPLGFSNTATIYINVWLDYDPTGYVDVSYSSALGVIRYSAQSSSTVPSKPSAATGVISSTSIQQVLNSPEAFIGFSAATSGATEYHTVELWTFQGSYCTPDLHPGCSSFALNSCYCQVCSTNYVSNGNGGCYVTSFATPVTSSSFPLYSLNGNAVLSNNLVQLTSKTSSQASSVYIKAGINVANSFSMFVQVAINCSTSLTAAENFCADGFAINFQPTNPFLVGTDGGDIGILDQSTAFYSVGIETYGKNTLSLYVHPANGSANAVNSANLSLANSDTATINVWIDYNPSLSSPFVVFYSNQTASNPTKPTTSIFSSTSTLYSVLNSVSAYVGLSASTGAINQQQVINSWIFCSNSADLSCISPTTATVAPTSTAAPTSTVTSTLTPTLTSTPAATTAATTDAPTTPGSTVSPTPVSASTSSALSTGAIAAIATIFSLLGVVLIALLIFFLVRRRQNRPRDTTESNDRIGMIEKN